jgi:hypothetical protein
VELMHDFMANKDNRKKILGTFRILILEMKSTKKAVKVESERDKKERIAKEGKKYWEKLTQVLPDETLRVWKVIL